MGSDQKKMVSLPSSLKGRESPSSPVFVPFRSPVVKTASIVLFFFPPFFLHWLLLLAFMWACPWLGLSLNSFVSSLLFESVTTHCNLPFNFYLIDWLLKYWQQSSLLEKPCYSGFLTFFLIPSSLWFFCELLLLRLHLKWPCSPGLCPQHTGLWSLRAQGISLCSHGWNCHLSDPTPHPLPQPHTHTQLPSRRISWICPCKSKRGLPRRKCLPC